MTHHFAMKNNCVKLYQNIFKHVEDRARTRTSELTDGRTDLWTDWPTDVRGQDNLTPQNRSMTSRGLITFIDANVNDIQQPIK